MASTRSYISASPSVVSLPGLGAGALGVALDRIEARTRIEILGDEGIRVEVQGIQGTVARAAYLAATRLLEELGEEAQLRIRVELAEPSISPVPAIVASVATGIIGLLGIEPAPMDFARILNRVTAETSGVPMAPLIAAALYGGVSVGSENPPLYARLPGTPPWRLYVVGTAVEETSREEVMVTIDRLRQIVSGLGALLGYIISHGWAKRLQGFLSQPSPWDVVAPSIVDKARRLALEEGALGASIDPYLGHLVVIAEDRAPAERAARVLASTGHKPFIVEAVARETGALSAEEAPLATYA